MIGRTLSHFRITAKLGEGGMGEVYRAEDTRLDREVAIKILPEALTGDPERLARFEREAKVLASLNHPNIAGIHQVEEADGQSLLVMELAPGEDLSERLARGPLTIEEAVDIAAQVAEGLAAAHERGIVHRDLKPGNIKVTPDGQVKVLDFGLAKAHEASSESSPDMTQSPTLTVQMTAAGVILGTAAYMSPEQARGQEADPRSDIWALGVVLWEMLTGRRLFAEPTVSDTLAAVLRADIDLDALPAQTPPALRRVLARCLSRDAKRRYHAAADVRLDLVEAVGDTADGDPESTRAPARSSRLPWIVAAAATVVALLLAVTLKLRPAPATTTPDARRVVASLLPPAGVGFQTVDRGLALSPDGTRLAFIGRSDGRQSIWLRRLERDEARELPDTEGAQGLFWSYDGRAVGFTQDDRVKTLDLESGVVETLSGPVMYAGGANWCSSGDIVYGQDYSVPLLAVDQLGGEPRPVTEEPESGDHYFGPECLPDGEHFLFHARRYGSEAQIGQIRIGSLDGSPSRPLFEAYSLALYADPGWILWWHQGNLRAQRFDLDRLELIGEPVVVLADVSFHSRSATIAAAVSDTGVLVYQPGGRVADNQLTWFDRVGTRLGDLGEPGTLYSPALSPDGSRVALDISGDSNQGDIWVLDAERGSGTRSTVWPEDDSSPVWSPDGRELAFFSNRDGGDRVYRTALSGSAEPQLLFENSQYAVRPRDWSPDGRALLVTASAGTTQIIISVSPETGDWSPLIETEARAHNPRLSPDGRWLAWDSDETGRKEVYLTSYPEPGARVRVSTEGGYAPMFSPAGDEIFFVSVARDAIVAVDFEVRENRPVLGQPIRLFDVDVKVHSERQYDTADGQRFLVNTEAATGAQGPLELVLGWTDGL